ncbi:monothiol glutaredoxin GRX3 [Sugiyamaella lignohabitans]|uniref:Monothiol glutaredoxin GRX3 n=1 Tax=Sugiyamaella lignohabitans TaxID=796027 RepID=A0A161HJU7_9ASCO|nr:monothiol glutaredoxin GRX3 [Sugiyamaella lignohabitans]ANB13067.1 monothiol glutaredoxin GRX3 [Sugiyamaella lignohabitans]
MPFTEVTSDAHFTELTTSVSPSTLIALYFHTPWADPCVQMNTVFKSLSDIYPQHLFVSVNADEFPDISESFDVSAVPFIVFLRESTIIKELSGANPKELASTIQSLTGGSHPSAEKGATSSNGTTAANSSSTGPSFVPSGPSATPSNEEEETEEELNKRLTKLINAAPVMLFMKGTPAEPKCGFSRQLVAILRENQVRFGFFDILKDNSVRQGLKTFSDWPTFPQLYIKGELQGGLDIIKESIAEDPKFFENAVA